MSKSLRTQQHYAVAFQGQGKLTGFGFKAPSYSPRVHGTILRGKSSLSPVVEPNQQPTAQPPPQPKPFLLTLGPSQSSQVRSASMLSDPSTDNDEETRPGLGDVAENEETESRRSDLEKVTNQDETEVEDCEDELEESMQGAASHIHNWTDLQKDIKDHLKKSCKILPLS